MAPPVITGFRRLYPKIQIDLDVTVSAQPSVENYDITLPGVPNGHWRLWPAEQPAQAVELDVQPALWANHTDALLRGALLGAGITSSPLNLAAPYLLTGELVRVLAPWITGRLALYAALPSRKFIPQRTRVFLDYLVQITREQSDAALAALEVSAQG